MSEENEERMTEGEKEAFIRGMAIGMYEATRDVGDELVHLGINNQQASAPIAKILFRDVQSALDKNPSAYEEELRRRIWKAISKIESPEEMEEFLERAFL